MKIKFTGLFLGLAILFSLLPCTKVFAWSYEEDTFSDEGYWMVDDFSDKTASVELYICVPKKDKNAMFLRGNYDFLCFDGDFPNGTGIGAIRFEYLTENKTVLASNDDCEIWIYQFKIEPGSYEFANNLNNEISTGDTLYVLNEALEFHNELPANWMDYTMNPKEYHYEERIVKEGDIVRIYALRGYSEHTVENFDTYMSNLKHFAKDRTLFIEEYNHGNAGVITDDTESEPQDPFAFVDTYPTVTPTVDDTPVILEEAEVVEEEKKFDFLELAKQIGAVSILVILGFVVAKQKRRDY